MVTTTGGNRTGVVAAVAGTIAEAGGDIQDMSQTLVAGNRIQDQEVIPGVENLQIQFGIDMNEDNTVDRYVNPGDPIYDPSAAAGYVPGARVLTARVWLVVRGVTTEFGLQDARNYAPGNANMGQMNDSFRRLQVSKTILLRNARI